MWLLKHELEETWTRWNAAREESQRILTEQQIARGQPGTILSDVEQMLEWISPQGIPLAKGNRTAPPALLPLWNRNSSCPIEVLDLKRALLRDYPNLAGTFILLRVLDLVQLKNRRLGVNPAVLTQWQELNPTEQYFSLLDALMFHAQPAIVTSEKSTEAWEGLRNSLKFMGRLSDRWHEFRDLDATYYFGPRGDFRPWAQFLLQQFGLVELRARPSTARRKPSHPRGWLLAAARLTPWGKSVAWALTDSVFAYVQARKRKAGRLQMELTEILKEPATEPLDDSLTDPEADEDSSDSSFPTLNTVFEPYFPELKKIYVLQPVELRPGTYLFKVSPATRDGDTGVWRRIATPATSSLEELAHAILKAFRFSTEYPYRFEYRDERGVHCTCYSPEYDDDVCASDIVVGRCELPNKGVMVLKYEDWRFNMRLEQVLAKSSNFRRPKVIEAAGEPPNRR